MKNIFVWARHWQLFLLLFLVPVGFSLYWFISLDFHMFRQSETISRSEMLNFPIMLRGVMMKMMILQGAANLLTWLWIWSVGETLQKKVPDNVRNYLPRLRLFFILQWVFIGLLILGMFLFMHTTFTNPLKFMWVPMLFFPIGMASLVINAFFLYYASKIIKTAELQREVTFKDHTNEFIMLWFYPIGVWFIQPLINKLGKGS